MKARYFLITCVIIVLGALYGRFRFLLDQDLIRTDASFVDYLMRKADKPAVPDKDDKAGDDQPAPHATSTGNPDAKATNPSPEKTTTPPSSNGKETGTNPNNAAPPEASETELRLAEEALTQGRYADCLAMLNAVPGEKADRIILHASMLQELVRNVAVDPGAHAEKIFEVSLTNGNPLYAVKADRVGEDWDLTLVNGINTSGLSIQSVKEIDAAAFRAQRKTVLQQEMSGMPSQSGGNSFGGWKAMRLAWRRGYPDLVYQVFADMAKTDSVLRALAMVLPENNQSLLAMLDTPRALPQPPTTTGDIAQNATTKQPDRHTGPSITSPNTSTPATTIPDRTATLPIPTGDTATVYASIDQNIKAAKQKIYQALGKDGAQSKALLKEAGAMIVSARNTLMNTPSLPRDAHFHKRMQQVTIILEDFLKMSGFQF